MSPWRNWLARPTVNREVDSSILSGDACFFALLLFFFVREKYICFCGSGVGKILAFYGARVWFSELKCGMLLVLLQAMLYAMQVGMCAHIFLVHDATHLIYVPSHIQALPTLNMHDSSIPT